MDTGASLVRCCCCDDALIARRRAAGHQSRPRMGRRRRGRERPDLRQRCVVRLELVPPECTFGRRPRTPPHNTGVLWSERGRHSEKPEEAFEAIERWLKPGVPKVELFARARRDGWDGWGDQYPVDPASDTGSSTVERRTTARRAVEGGEGASVELRRSLRLRK